MKRSISIVLVLAICLSFLNGISIYAQTIFSDVYESDYYAEAALVLADKGILGGYPDGTFCAQKSITRAEMAAIICRVLSRESQAKVAVGNTVFSDVPATHWASGYVNVASKAAVINGDGNGIFRPDAPVKHEEAIKMVICAFGMNEGIDIIPDDWSANYIKRAEEKGITTNLKGFKGEYSTRGDVAVMVYNALSAFALTEFEASSNYFSGEMSEMVLFTVKAGVTDKKVELYCDGIKSADMNDEGLDGDYIARDGIYSCSVSVSGLAGEVKNFCAISGNTQSNAEELYFFGKPNEQITTETLETSDVIISELQNIELEYADENGIIKKENMYVLLDAWDEYLAERLADGSLLVYEVSDDCVYLKYPSGFCVTYAPNVGDVSNGGGSVSLSVKTLQPCFTDMQGEADNYTELNQLNFVDWSAENVAKSFTNCNYKEEWNYDDSEVTLDLIKNFGANEVILWQGHGIFTEKTKSVLLTGEAFDQGKYNEGGAYYEDIITDRVIDQFGDYLCITPAFIKHYCKDLSNSLFYIGTCGSGKSDDLAKAFLNKGAAAVVANTDTILRVYNLKMIDSVVGYMCNINQATGAHYTLGEALAASKERIGSSDSVFNGGRGATPVIFGGHTAEDYRFGETVYSEYSYYGDAALQEDGNVELTPLDYWRSGSVWYKTPFDTSKNVEIRFSYWAGGGIDSGSNGADGILCMFAHSPGLGADGEYMGIVGDDTWGIEFDSYPFNLNDPDEKHVAVIYGKVSNHVSFNLTNMVDDSRWHDVRISYKKNDFQVILDGNPVLMHRDIILPETCYIGFSAATGADLNRHMIKGMFVSVYGD